MDHQKRFFCSFCGKIVASRFRAEARFEKGVRLLKLSCGHWREMPFEDAQADLFGQNPPLTT